jgi:hypothetical protein
MRPNNGLSIHNNLIRNMTRFLNTRGLFRLISTSKGYKALLENILAQRKIPLNALIHAMQHVDLDESYIDPINRRIYTRIIHTPRTHTYYSQNWNHINELPLIVYLYILDRMKTTNDMRFPLQLTSNLPRGSIKLARLKPPTIGNVKKKPSEYFQQKGF